jgi:hypothetical protein
MYNLWRGKPYINVSVVQIYAFAVLDCLHHVAISSEFARLAEQITRLPA